ncbi:MAG: alpha/beta fold hydrolase [bacterium]|nr:alpha/beta fold hydrolase [bacterium]
MHRSLILLSFCIATVLSLGTPADVGEVHAGMIDIGNGELYYELAGSGPTIVLLHGGMLDCRMWDGQMDALSENYRVLRYDARGHGRSDPINGEHSHYKDLAQLMDTLEVERAVIVGLSLGGRTAIDFALEYPDRIRALVPVAPGLSGWKFNDPVLVEHWEGMRKAAESNDLETYVEWFQRSWTDGPHREPVEVDSVVREKVRAMARATVDKPGEMGSYIEAGAIDRLSEIKSPTLVMVGELDMQDILDISDRLASEVADSKRVVIPKVAHMVNMEAPDEFNARLLAFLQTLNLE